MKRGVCTHTRTSTTLLHVSLDYFSFLVASIRFLLSRTHSNLSNDFFSIQSSPQCPSPNLPLITGTCGARIVNDAGRGGLSIKAGGGGEVGGMIV